MPLVPSAASTHSFWPDNRHVGTLERNEAEIQPRIFRLPPQN